VPTTDETASGRPAKGLVEENKKKNGKLKHTAKKEDKTKRSRKGLQFQIYHTHNKKGKTYHTSEKSLQRAKSTGEDETESSVIAGCYEQSCACGYIGLVKLFFFLLSFADAIVFALQDPFSLNSHPRIAAIAYPRRSSS
jgi:hypothetical protein